MFWITQTAIKLMERGALPDSLIRLGIRRLLKERLSALPLTASELEQECYMRDFLEGMNRGPVAPLPEKANEQHYELPPEFFRHVLGVRRKYSSCYWPEGETDLGRAETAALAETCDRARLEDAQTVLELGCGWGSLSIWMAEHYPASRITAVSNSHSQRLFIQGLASRLRLGNLEVITCDMNEFSTAGRFDRIVSVEMFEHMRNWKDLFARVGDWLKPGGKFFMHIFCHRALPYEFEAKDDSDWMSRYFFSGGMMPSQDLPACFQEAMHLEQRWQWNGVHYQKTADAWLANMDRNREKIWPILEETYGSEGAPIWWMRWRVFFMACSELFGYRQGEEWMLGHYLFQRPSH